MYTYHHHINVFLNPGSSKQEDTKKVDWEEEVRRLERQLENYRHVVEQQEHLIEVTPSSRRSPVCSWLE